MTGRVRDNYETLVAKTDPGFSVVEVKLQKWVQDQADQMQTARLAVDRQKVRPSQVPHPTADVWQSAIGGTTTGLPTLEKICLGVRRMYPHAAAASMDILLGLALTRAVRALEPPTDLRTWLAPADSRLPTVRWREPDEFEYTPEGVQEAAYFMAIDARTVGKMVLSTDTTRRDAWISKLGFVRGVEQEAALRTEAHIYAMEQANGRRVTLRTPPFPMTEKTAEVWEKFVSARVAGVIEPLTRVPEHTTYTGYVFLEPYIPASAPVAQKFRGPTVPGVTSII